MAATVYPLKSSPHLLRGIIAASGIRQTQIAAALGISRMRLYDQLTGRRRLRPETVAAVLAAATVRGSLAGHAAELAATLAQGGDGA